jgi:uncharacterized repeat protein (TIGR04076 family)
MSRAKRTDRKVRGMESPSGKTEKQSCPISRREFCVSVPFAVIGGLSFSNLMEASISDIPFPSSKGSLNIEEEKMAKKVIAVTAKVISQKGTCALSHKVGDVAQFTETGVEGKICIHALYSMLPAVFAMMFEARFPWLEKNPDKKTHACPDANNPVVFEIERIREK